MTGTDFHHSVKENVRDIIKQNQIMKIHHILCLYHQMSFVSIHLLIFVLKEGNISNYFPILQIYMLYK